MKGIVYSNHIPSTFEICFYGIKKIDRKADPPEANSTTLTLTAISSFACLSAQCVSLLFSVHAVAKYKG